MELPGVEVMNSLKGRFVSNYNYSKPIEGEIIHVIKGGDQLTHQQMLLWAKIDTNHKCYKSVRGPAKVDRVVLSINGDARFIAPLWMFI